MKSSCQCRGVEGGAYACELHGSLLALYRCIIVNRPVSFGCSEQCKRKGWETNVKGAMTTLNPESTERNFVAVAESCHGLLIGNKKKKKKRERERRNNGLAGNRLTMSKEHFDTYCTAIPIAAIMYAPRRILMYLGNNPARSIPVETELRTTLIYIHIPLAKSSH